MKKFTCALAILAAVSTAAVAKDLKQDKKTMPTVAATQMSDAEMDKVTAGEGQGVDTACFSANGTPACFRPDYVNQAVAGHAAVNVAPGHGTLTRY
jgi:hypothetical protein